MGRRKGIFGRYYSSVWKRWRPANTASGVERFARAPLLFNNLPSGLDPASVQVSARARGDIVLGPVSGRVIRAEPKRETMTL
jgi:hypothetical protein